MDLLILIVAAILVYYVYILKNRVVAFAAALRSMEDRLRHLEEQRLQDRSPVATPIDEGVIAPEKGAPSAPHPAEPVALGTPAPLQDVAPPPSPRPRPTVVIPRLSTELEVVIGTSWLNRVGIIAIIAAVAYFLKYSFDNQWIGPAGRVILTWLLGVALVGGGELYQRRKLAVFAQGLTGGGMAVLYFAAYAAFAMYRLIGWTPSFLVMVLITGAAVVLALRYESMAIATLGLVAGFAAPVLLSAGGGGAAGGTGQPVAAGLYGYLLLLDAATYVLARRKQWWILGGVGLVAAFLLPVIVGQAGRPNPGAGVAYFLLITLALLALSVAHAAERLAWAAVAGGFVVSLAGGIEPAFRSVPYLDLAYFGVITLAAIYVADRLNWPRVANAAFLAGLVLGSAWIFVGDERSLPPAAAYFLVVNAVMLYASLRRQWRKSELFALIANAFVATPTLVFSGHAPAATRIVGTALLFVLYNVTLARASREDTTSRLAAIPLSSAVFAAQLGWILNPSRDALALAAVILAAYHVAVARTLQRHVPQLTVLLFLGLAVTFLTVAVPLKLGGEAVALAWAVETVALAWAAGRTRSVWAGRAAVVVAAATVARLIVVDTTRIEAAGPIATIPGLAFASGIAALTVAQRFLRRLSWPSPEERHLPAGLGATAAALLFVWGSWEIDGVFSRGGAAVAATGVKQVALSAWFAVYGVGVVVAGIWKGAPAVRWTGIVLLSATILKVFFVDLVAVAVVFRVLSLAILGVLLLLASLAYSRSRARLTRPDHSGRGTLP